MSNKLYDTLKTIALFFVPLSVFISSMIGICEIPNADKITAVLAALDTLLGALVKIAQMNYDDKKKAELDETRRLNGQDN